MGEVRRLRQDYSFSAVPSSASLRIPDSPELFGSFTARDIAHASFLYADLHLAAFSSSFCALDSLLLHRNASPPLPSASPFLRPLLASTRPPMEITPYSR